MTRRSLLLAPALAWAAEDWVAADGSAFPKESWRITPEGLEAVGGLATFQDIKTVRLYTDFDFEFEWKMLAQGNSGVKYQLLKWDRWQPPGKSGFHIRARGPEFQLSDDAITDDKAKQCGSLYGQQAPVRPAKVRLGEFNTARLRLQGQTVEHWINGEMLLEYQLPQVKPSAISLQNHACNVWFRKLRIKAA